MRFTIFAVILVVLSSCSVQNIKLVESSGVQFTKVDGNNYSFNVGAKFDNPNWFGVRLKKANFEVYAQDKYIGIMNLEQKVKLKRKSVSDVNVPLMLMLDQGAIWDVFKLAKQNEVEVHLKGKVKGGVFIFSKKMDVDERKTIPTKGMKLNP